MKVSGQLFAGNFKVHRVVRMRQVSLDPYGHRFVYFEDLKYGTCLDWGKVARTVLGVHPVAHLDRINEELGGDLGSRGQLNHGLHWAGRHAILLRTVTKIYVQVPTAHSRAS